MGGEGSFEGFECGSLCWTLHKRHIFLRKIVQRATDLREVHDKPAIEIGKLDEPLYIFEVFRCRPLRNCLDLSRVHSDGASANEETEVFDFVSLEFAFLWAEKQIVLGQTFKHLMDYLVV